MATTNLDLPQRLRDLARCLPGTIPTQTIADALRDAADEIDRLRRYVAAAELTR